MKPLSVARVVGGGSVVGEVGDELEAVREFDGVGPTEGDEFFDSEATFGEELGDLGDGHGGGGEVGGYGEGEGGLAVATTEEDEEEGAVEHGQEVAGGVEEDVRARDGVGAGELEGGLGTDDEVKGVAWEGMVDVGVALNLGEGDGGEKDGGIAVIGEKAVVEEEAEGGNDCGGAHDLLAGYYVPNDLAELWTRVIIEE